jgi:hypothetical protein
MSTVDYRGTMNAAEPVSAVWLDRVQWCEAFARETAVLITRVRDAPTLTTLVPGLDWTVGDVANHLSVVYTAFALAIAGGDLSVFAASVATDGTLPERLAATNANVLSLMTVLEPRDAADALQAAADEVPLAVAACPDLRAMRTAPWYGIDRSVGVLAAMALSETLVHGLDMARALRLESRIRRESARVIAPTVVAEMLPLLVNEEGARGVRVTYEYRIRGAQPFILALADGVATSRPVGVDDEVDCVVSVDPVAALLLGYGRLSVRRAIVTGKALSFGRAPWLALEFPSLFVQP